MCEVNVIQTQQVRKKMTPPCENDLYEMQREMQREQAEPGMEIEIEHGQTVRHKDRIRYWLENRAHDANDNIGDGPEMILFVSKRSPTEMSIPRMIKRWQERFNSCSQSIGINRDGVTCPILKTHEEWLWGINAFSDNAEGERRHQIVSHTYQGRILHELFGDPTDKQMEEQAREDGSFWNWLNEDPSRSVFEYVDEGVGGRPLYWGWRRSERRHLESLEVVKGQLAWRDGMKTEDVRTKECRMKAVHQMWDTANELVDYETLQEEAEKKISLLQEQDRRNKKPPSLYEAKVTDHMKPWTMRTEKPGEELGPEQRKEKVEELSRQIQEEIEELRKDVDSYHQQAEKVANAQDNFDELFRVQPKWDLCNQHVDDTLMLMSLMIDERSKKEGFETE